MLKSLVDALTLKELIQINEEWDNEFIEKDALLREVACKAFNTDSADLTKMMMVITYSATVMAKALKLMLDPLNKN